MPPSRAGGSGSAGRPSLPPRSPKLNGEIERAQRTHTEEFYQVFPCSLELAALNRELRKWEQVYSTVRPHQGLGLSHPAFPAAGCSPTRGVNITNLLDEYTGLHSQAQVV